MGQEIQRNPDSPDDLDEVLRRLREETALLSRWFQEGRFASCEGHTIGLELEMWLVDENFQPLPENKKFLSTISDPKLVPELSKYNAELNAEPLRVQSGSLHDLFTCLSTSWQRIQDSMRTLKGHMLTIGTLPTVEESMLNLESMSDFERYRALNEYVLHLRRGKPMRLHIEGQEHLQTLHHDIMLEAAATSFQVHIQPPYELVTATYNAAVITSCVSVALGANSPFLFGADLWDETRIPLFEQSICLPGFTLLDGTRQQRVTFGSGYVQDSLMELFWENAQGYPVLLPLLTHQAPEQMSHVDLQNNTIWRWNRPVLGQTLDGQPALRVEHRVMSAGPSLEDMVADLAFFLGLCHDLASSLQDPHEFMPFTQARSNFYAAAKDGLKARVIWGKQDEVTLQELILEHLLPAARRGLRNLHLSEDEIAHYLDGIIKPRVASLQTGASWQRQWVNAHGKDWSGLTAAYFGNQETKQPVHTWLV
jgi:gamma-glutamyl:cysteine ligase YbdK (ATP-grasp superfamily)